MIYLSFNAIYIIHKQIVTFINKTWKVYVQNFQEDEYWRLSFGIYIRKFKFMLILSEFVVDLYTFLNALYLIFTTFSCGGDYQTFRHQKRIVKSTQYT